MPKPKTKFAGSANGSARLLPRLEDLIKGQSPKSEKTFAVIDGLDKCDSLPLLLPFLEELATSLSAVGMIPVFESASKIGGS